MTLDADSGVWSATGDASWDRMYYDFTLEVYTYAESALVTNTVTDPYSVSLSANSANSQIVNLDDLDLQPPGWDALTLPSMASPRTSPSTNCRCVITASPMRRCPRRTAASTRPSPWTTPMVTTI